MTRELATVGIVLFAIKLAWLCIDHTLRVYMGDSMTYLHSAAMLTGTGGRSFLYGWTLRFTALPFDTPVAVIAVQALWSLLTSLALFAFLRHALRASFWWSAVPAWLLAAEPVQVFMERMVMAETLGLLAFVTTVLVFARYLATGNLRWYFLATLGGLAAAAFRMNFLPVAIGLGLSIPLVYLFLNPAPHSQQRTKWGRHLALALAMLAGTHLAYTHAYGYVTKYPPGYLAYTGMMRIGLVAPLIRPEHFEGTGVSGDILEQVKRPLDDHWQRGHHIWEKDGLWPMLEKHSEQPELVARTITRRAMLGDPVGLLKINVATLGGYFDDRRSRLRMLDDKGVSAPSERDLQLILAWTGWDARGIDQTETPARAYFAASAGWLTLCLFVLAPLALATSFMCWRHPRRDQYLLLALASLGLVANHLLFAHIVSYRYIHPFPWFVLANLAAIACLVTARRRASAPAGPVRATAGRPAP
ncbi:hypothetical protein [Luteimonas salinilitoris]